MTEVASLLNPLDGSNILAVQAFKGLQLEPPTKDLVEYNGDVEPITKEEEVITKKKTELTTTKQIETRVKRQVVLEDGKVIQDSGPIVHTNTTEDTDKQESESTERRNLGTDDVDGPEPIEYASNENSLTKTPGVLYTTVARPDGLVREVKTKKVVSREEVQERLETEDVKHLGDFSDETYVKAVNSGVENLQSALYSASAQKQQQLDTIGPRIVHQSTKAHKTIDTEDIDLKCLAQPDGTLVTERKNTTEHEELFDEDLPDEDDNSTGSREKIDQKESSQKFFKQRDEQAVEYIADGKIIGKEMRYAAETEQMERDGPQEDPSDWDSLSDRVRKARRLQKTLLQQHKEALLADRKDALTKRPLDFDKEEETRKGETIKWLENHFGNESRSSRESRDDNVEPTKKSFFNVTIKSNPTTPSSVTSKPFPGNGTTNNYPTNIDYITSSKMNVAEKDLSPSTSKPKTFFQGISEWSERKEPSTPPPPAPAPSSSSVKQTKTSSNHYGAAAAVAVAGKSFHDELRGTLEKSRLKHGSSRENLLYGRNDRTGMIRDDYARKDGISTQHHSNRVKNDKKYNSSRNDRIDSGTTTTTRDDSDDSHQLRYQKEDLGYLSGSRSDLRMRKDSKNDDIYGISLKKTKQNGGYLHREDSGYVKDSTEDVRLVRNGLREDSFIRGDSGEEEKHYKDNKTIIQRDDSAYVSSSTYYTAPRSPKSQMRTPDSGIRSPSPDTYDTEEQQQQQQQQQRPTVPQRKRVLEKKLRLTQQNGYPVNGGGPVNGHGNIVNGMRKHENDLPPEFLPRSRSASPVSLSQQQLNGGMKKYQRTRFASSEPTSPPPPQSTNTMQNGYHQHRSVTPQNSSQSINNKQTNKVSTSIGNSLRKLVGKIRSASAERKLKIKTKRSPSPHKHNQQQQQQHQQQQQQPQQNQHQQQTNNMTNGSTYQQYNVIDGHIGQISNRESSITSSSKREPRTLDRRESSESDMISPKQKYYLGEDPYGGSIYGKENKYDGSIRLTQQQHNHIRRLRSEDVELYSPSRNISSSQNLQQTSANTLGRFSKSTNKLTSTPISTSSILSTDNDYRNTQTLPRKLDHNRPLHSSTINVSIVNSVKSSQNNLAAANNNNHLNNIGPAKPARTYKSLNRSKSFNVHGLNGTNDPSPIYMEKLNKNFSHSLYKSNPHLNEEKPQLKSPSIVNLISRSQKDLTKIDEDYHYNNNNNNSNNNHNNSSNYIKYSSNERKLNGGGSTNYLNGGTNFNRNGMTAAEKRSMFLRGLQDQAPELYKSLHGSNGGAGGGGGGNIDVENDLYGKSSYRYNIDKNIIRDRERDSSLGSRSPITINKDTASIIRRGSSSTDDYSEIYKITSKSDDPLRPSITNTVHSFTKKTIPNKLGLKGTETIESTERKTVMTSRYKGEPMSNLKYIEEKPRRGSGGGGGGGPVVIEVRNGVRK